MRVGKSLTYLMIRYGLVSIVLLGCKGPLDTSENDRTSPLLASILEGEGASGLAVLIQHCAVCHGSGSPGFAEINYITDIQQLIDNKLIVPGNPGASGIYITSENGTMPPEGRLDAEELEAIANLIISLSEVVPETPVDEGPSSADLEIYRKRLLDGKYTPQHQELSQKDPEALEFLALFFYKIDNELPVEPLPEKYRIFEPKKVFTPSGLTAKEQLERGIVLERGTPDGPADHHSIGYKNPNTCKQCHERQFNEWEGSIMHYSAISPTFWAFQNLFGIATNGQLPAGAVPEKFCASCHAPAAFEGPQGNGPFFPQNGVMIRDLLSDNELEGVSCHYCHSVNDLDKTLDPARGLFGDGVANFSALTDPGSDTYYGQFDNPEITVEHKGQKSEIITESQLCFTCHDVRVGAHDSVTGESFRRIENLVVEYKELFLRDLGRTESCQDCHMSMYPMMKEGTRPVTQIADTSAALGYNRIRKDKKHSRHGLTAVSKPLLDDPRMPNTTTTNLDEFGYPLGQAQRKEMMLRSAVNVAVDFDKTELISEVGEKLLKLRINVTNVGAGHRVPSGFAQEREVWLWLDVRDKNNKRIYRSGYLNPKDDFNLEAELAYLEEAAPDICEATTFEHGDDYRDEDKKLGLFSVRNKFIREVTKTTKNDEGEDVVETYNEEVFCAFRATGIETHSLIPGVDTPAEYDIKIPNGEFDLTEIKVKAVMQFRALPPHFVDLLRRSENLRAPTRTTSKVPIVTQEIYEKSIEDIVDMAGTNVIFNTTNNSFETLAAPVLKSGKESASYKDALESP